MLIKIVLRTYEEHRAFLSFNLYCICLNKWWSDYWRNFFCGFPNLPPPCQRMRNRDTERETEKQTERQRNRQTNRQTDIFVFI